MFLDEGDFFVVDIVDNENDVLILPKLVEN